jgi:hypothetical protein
MHQATMRDGIRFEDSDDDAYMVTRNDHRSRLHVLHFNP